MGTIGAPEWFRLAMETPVDVGQVRVDGVDISFRAWGQASAPTVLLIHGVAANANWWDHIGPLLCESRRVIALSLSGHGDSGHRRSYSYETWADEVRAVLHEFAAPRPVIIAHSMGGRVAYQVAAHTDSLGGVAFLDSGFAKPPSSGSRSGFAEIAATNNRIYRDQDSAVAAFQPIGTFDRIAPYLARHVGLRSVRRVERGWTWKFDPSIFSALARPHDASKPISCPAALIRAGRNSVLSDEAFRATQELLGPDAVYEVLASSGHHVMFDAPRELAAQLQALLHKWS
ncbi:alpha/beta fold hydrolase [Hoyosella altamirensis]|nr:alpha/beta hydrolase [Hoyosella altamirensis]